MFFWCFLSPSFAREEKALEDLNNFLMLFENKSPGTRHKAALERAFLEAAEEFAKEADYSELNGWAEEGWKPCNGYYVGGECGQGFFHTLFYKRQTILKEKLLGAGQKWNPLQIDKCIWNYQTTFQCDRDFDCSRVRVHHKPMKPGSDPRECLKTKGKVLASKTSSPISATSHSLVRLLSTNEPARHKDGDKTARFGFYFPVHDQVEGVIEVLKSARHFYPEAPIYVPAGWWLCWFRPFVQAAKAGRPKV